MSKAKTEEAEVLRRQRISAAKKGKKHSPEHIAKLAAIAKEQYASGKRKPAGGTHDTSEARERQRQIALKQHEEGRMDKSGLALGASRTTKERSAAWTPERRAAQAQKTLSAYQDGRMKGYGRYRGHWSLYDGPKGQINMRSGSEVLFACKLDEHGLDWQYEPRRFDLGWSTYLPDFYLPAQNLWVEVKGYLTPTATRKITDFQALGHRLVVATYTEVRAAGLPSELQEVSLHGV